MTELATAPGPADAFPSLAALQKAHKQLADVDCESGCDINADGPIREFVRKAVTTGRFLDSRDDRRTAQASINYWVSTVATASREAGRRDHPFQSAKTETLLADYDPATVSDTVAAADRVIAGLNDDEKKLARMILLRLVRLRGDESGAPTPSERYATVQFDSKAVTRLRASERDFDPVTAMRDDFSRFGTKDARNDILKRLVDSGVVRLVPGEIPSTDQFSLRSAGLLTDWPTLRTWMAERRAIRDGAREWYVHRPTNERPRWKLLRWVGSKVDWLWTAVVSRLPSSVRKLAESDKLLTGSPLDEARRFHDRSEIEREFLDACRNREILTGERNRVLMGVFGVLAAAAAIGWIFAVLAAVRAKEEANYAKRKVIEAQLAEAKASEKEALANAAAAVSNERLRLSSLRVVIRGYADVASADSAAGKRIALERWKSIANQKPLSESLKSLDLPLLLRQAEGARQLQNARAAASNRDDGTDANRVIEEIRKVRPKLLELAETREALRAVRKTAFEVVRFCSWEFTKSIEGKKHYVDVEPYAEEFWRQYWGEMLLVEGPRVRDAMVEFGSVVGEIRDFAIRPEAATPAVPPPVKKDGPPTKDAPKAVRPTTYAAPAATPASPLPAAVTNDILEKSKLLTVAELQTLSKRLREREIPERLRTALIAAQDRLNKALDAESGNALLPDEKP